jgi:hypothetical protein
VAQARGCGPGAAGERGASQPADLGRGRAVNHAAGAHGVEAKFAGEDQAAEAGFAAKEAHGAGFVEKADARVEKQVFQCLAKGG